MLAQYSSFFAASAAASATLVGLLFVALSIDVGLENEFRVRQFALSETAFISLGGIFIISLFALLPEGSRLAAIAAILLSIIGIADMFRIERMARRLEQAIDAWYVEATVGSYLCLAVASVWLLWDGFAVVPLHIFCFLLVALSAVSLARAWRALLITKRKPQ